jgi:hypothetical protein
MSGAARPAPRAKRRHVVDEWPELAAAIRQDRRLRLNLLGAIVDATRDEWKRRRASGNGEALVGEEGRSLQALEARLLESFRLLDEARQRVALWSATIERGDANGWGRK